MQTYSWISNNIELFKFIYSLIIVLICVTIVLKTNRIFKLSHHQGIRYFRNAFFFYGIAFVFRYILGSRVVSQFIISSENYFIIIGLFEFFLIMAGFSLFYSLIWKRFEKSGKGSFSSLFNGKMLILYIMAIILAALDFLWSTYLLMFTSQIILFAFASLISYINYKKKGSERKFLKFYFVAMLLSLIGWILNALLTLYLSWNKGILGNVYLINIIIFVLFLYGIIKITGSK
jgi:hypothetical protein